MSQQGVSLLTTRVGHVHFLWAESAEGTNLILVGGVEGDLGHLLVLVPHGFDGAAGQLNALQKG